MKWNEVTTVKYRRMFFVIEEVNYERVYHCGEQKEVSRNLILKTCDARCLLFDTKITAVTKCEDNE